MTTTWAVLYLRPDGWWIGGKGFEDEAEAEACAREQLPAHVSWRAYEVPKRARIQTLFARELPDEQEEAQPQ